MTPEQYEQVREVFLEAREMDASRRGEFLRRRCGDDDLVREEVESLLASGEEAETFLQTPALGKEFALGNPESLISAGNAAGVSDDASTRRPAGAASHPERIGQYTILDVLGEGGMGVVYRARQDRPRRPVALKVIKPGIESREVLQRFEHETEVLGWLQHPGIAQIYEAGTADTGCGPQPFFAMEYVEGQPLIKYAAQHWLAMPDRLELIAKVCDAVHHAHQKGVIHRDLKPSNILVDKSGQPKVLDFGVARIIDAEVRATTLQTGVGQLVGTVAYMSPEQVSGDPRQLDTRSDVYSLGVILYELLTGQLPLDVSGQTLPQAARTITEQEPASPSSVNRFCRGDVGTIVGKALEKDKNRRYQSASDLAADIRRHLADEPISARPPTTFYQLGKFAKRNRALVAGVAIAFVAVVGGLIHVTWQRNRALAAERLAEQRRSQAVAAEALAEEQLARAQAEAHKFQMINQFFNDMLASVDPGRSGRDVRVADVLDRAARDLGAELANQPEIETSLQNTIGTVYVGLGLFAEAEPHLRSALATRRQLFGAEHPDTLATMANLAAALKELGRLSEAEKLVRQVLEVRRGDLGDEHTETLRAMSMLADVLQRRGQVAEAETLWQQALTGLRRTVDPDDPELLITMNNLGQLLKQLRRPAEAEPLLREALELQLDSLGQEHPYTLACMSNLANTLKALGKDEEAEGLLRTVVEVRRRTLGEHPAVYSAINNLARLLQDQGRLAEAEPLLSEALEGSRQTLGEENRQTLVACNNLAWLWVELGRAAEAEALYIDLIATAKRTLPAGSWMTLVFERNYGQCLTAMGRYEEAERLLIPAYEGLEASLGPEHQHTHKTLEGVIALYQAWGKPDAAAQYAARAGSQTRQHQAVTEPPP